MNVYISQGSWVINIVGFFEVFCDVEPKRKALAAANAELAAAQEKLSKIKGKIKTICSSLVCAYLQCMYVCIIRNYIVNV